MDARPRDRHRTFVLCQDEDHHFPYRREGRCTLGLSCEVAPTETKQFARGEVRDGESATARRSFSQCASNSATIPVLSAGESAAKRVGPPLVNKGPSKVSMGLLGIARA